jgi:orotidine-5'-phosphate decarboxylase
MHAPDKYDKRVDEVDSLVCVGLDSNFDRLPERFRREPSPQFAFNRWIIEQTHPYVSAYKPNIAFYEALGDEGIRALKLTMEYLQQHHPDILTICDAKRADIGSTNDGYVAGIFDWLGFDAVTLNPYLGHEALQPFLERADKGCIIVCRTSNPGAGEFQDLEVGGRPLWRVVAGRVRDEWNEHGNCMLVVGATYPLELAKVREIVGDMTLLVPGVGAQGGDVGETVKAGLNSQNKGMIINSSRGIIFADRPGEAAQKLRDEINGFRLPGGRRQPDARKQKPG